jgi:hypothetical protein
MFMTGLSNRNREVRTQRGLCFMAVHIAIHQETLLRVHFFVIFFIQQKAHFWNCDFYDIGLEKLAPQFRIMQFSLLTLGFELNYRGSFACFRCPKRPDHFQGPLSLLSNVYLSSFLKGQAGQKRG